MSNYMAVIRDNGRMDDWLYHYSLANYCHGLGLYIELYNNRKCQQRMSQWSDNKYGYSLQSIFVSWRHDMESLSVLLGLCERKTTGPLTKA